MLRLQRRKSRSIYLLRTRGEKKRESTNRCHASFTKKETASLSLGTRELRGSLPCLPLLSSSLFLVSLPSISPAIKWRRERHPAWSDDGFSSMTSFIRTVCLCERSLLFPSLLCLCLPFSFISSTQGGEEDSLIRVWWWLALMVLKTPSHREDLEMWLHSVLRFEADPLHSNSRLSLSPLLCDVILFTAKSFVRSRSQRTRKGKSEREIGERRVSEKRGLSLQYPEEDHPFTHFHWQSNFC